MKSNPVSSQISAIDRGIDGAGSKHIWREWTIENVQRVFGHPACYLARNEENNMTINFAVDRLYQTGWLPTDNTKLERLPSGLRYPSVAAVQRVFEDAGLSLAITPHLMFGCYRAEWKALDGNSSGEELTGTVVGSCEAEAAVYALANLREQQFEIRATSEEPNAELAGI